MVVLDALSARGKGHFKACACPSATLLTLAVWTLGKRGRV